MRKLIFIIVAILVVLAVISKIEGDSWFLGLDKLKTVNLFWKHEIPLRTVHISQQALESYKLSIKSEAAVVLDAKKEEVLFEKNIEKKLPIASLTKLMTAMVFLETNPNLNDTATITLTDAENAGRSQLKMGEAFTLNDILHSSLMSSNNRATKTLARTCGLSPSEFVDRMNKKAKKIGLENTFFCEVTGLDTLNTSTALDCAKLVYFALQDSVISSISSKTTYEFSSLNKRKRRHEIKNTNKLLFSTLSSDCIGNVKGGKTGYNGPSGWCLGTLLEGEDGEEIIAVVLGAPTSTTRFKEIRSIVDWAIRINEAKEEDKGGS